MNEAEKFNWWWREKDKLLQLRGKLFADCERAAWSHELVRRAYPKKSLVPWPELSELDQRLAQERWSPADFSNFTAAKPTCQEMINNAVFHVKFDLLWNLTSSDSALAKTFIREIRAERAKRGVVIAGRNKGRKNRPVSWRQIEMLDRKLAGLEKQSDAERSASSKLLRKKALSLIGADGKWSKEWQSLLKSLVSADGKRLTF